MKKIALLAIVLSACGQKLDHGTVVDKHYQAAQIQRVCTPILVGKISVPVCEDKIVGPFYWITIKGPLPNGHLIAEEVQIDSLQYAIYNIGDRYLRQ